MKNFTILLSLCLIVGTLLIVKNWFFLLAGLFVCGWLLRWTGRWLRRRNYLSLGKGALIAISLGLLGLYALFLADYYYKEDKVSGFANSKTPNLLLTVNKDSVERYLNEARNFIRVGDDNKALEMLEQSSRFATVNDMTTVNREKVGIFKRQGEALLQAKQYEAAGKIYDGLLSLEPAKGEHLYRRAVARLGTGNVKDAVTDLKAAIEKGDRQATELHEKVNPLKKRMAYTVIRCKDGTISSSKSRKGTCSHHGGVENWEEPVYEEYRDYD